MIGKGFLRGLALPAAALLIAACQPTTESVVEFPALPQDCGAKKHAYLVGKSSDAARKALQSKEPVRFVTTGSAVTQDYVPARLTVWINAKDRVERLTCG